MGKLFFSLLLFFITSGFHAQNKGVQAVFKEKIEIGKAQFQGVDEFENLYVSKNNVFYKLHNQKEYQFYAPSLGKLTSVDLLNPLKIILFYRNANTVVVLDNNLNEITRVNFNSPGNYKSLFSATTSIASSIWVFDLNTKRLGRFDYVKKKTLAKSTPIDEEIILQNSNFNFCWLLGEKHLMKYNSYGSLIHSYPSQDIQFFTEDQGNVIILKNEQLKIQLKGEEGFRLIQGVKKPGKKFYLRGENFYLYNENAVFYYHLNLPN